MYKHTDVAKAFESGRYDARMGYVDNSVMFWGNQELTRAYKDGYDLELWIETNNKVISRR